jgi:hypothetical protein
MILDCEDPWLVGHENHNPSTAAETLITREVVLDIFRHELRCLDRL